MGKGRFAKVFKDPKFSSKLQENMKHKNHNGDDDKLTYEVVLNLDG